jgi:hypothetical protein
MRSAPGVYDGKSHRVSPRPFRWVPRRHPKPPSPSIHLPLCRGGQDTARAKRARCGSALQIADRKHAGRHRGFGPPTSSRMERRPMRGAAKSLRRTTAAAGAEESAAPQAPAVVRRHHRPSHAAAASSA